MTRNSYYCTKIERGSRVKVDESKLLCISRVSYCDTGIDKLLDVRRIVLSWNQYNIWVGWSAYRAVHDILQNVLQLKDIGIVGLFQMDEM